MTTSVWWSEVETELGPFGLASTEGGLVAILFEDELTERERRLRGLVGPHDTRPDDGRNAAAAGQLAEYARGARRGFDLRLDRRGTDFQRRAWAAVAAVPYGRTASYRQIAVRTGRPRAVRAVGAANGANPLPIVIPCHRIVGADGHLHGYAGGLAFKRRLLGLEGALPREDESWRAWAGKLRGRLIGPRSTRIYCRPECRYTDRLSRVPAIFDSAEEARAEGYRACAVCRP
jgi:O-6-methylguanine DNA methyltransferase